MRDPTDECDLEKDALSVVEERSNVMRPLEVAITASERSWCVIT